MDSKDIVRIFLQFADWRELADYLERWRTAKLICSEIMNQQTTHDGFYATRDQVIRKITGSLDVPSGLLFSGEYRNPFDFLREHDQWFEFEKRRRFDREPTYRIIADMLADDIPRALRAADMNYTRVKYAANDCFGRAALGSRSIFCGVTS